MSKETLRIVGKMKFGVWWNASGSVDEDGSEMGYSGSETGDEVFCIRAAGRKMKILGE